jgi:Protein of unknown function (DUF3025)
VEANDWHAGVAGSNPLFAPLTPWLDRFDGPGWPSIDMLNALALEARAQTVRGMPIRFTALAGKCRGYERHIAETGEIPTRARNWHDFFNALAWIAWPKSKAMLNALHLEEIGRKESDARGPVRDALTLLDESGVLVLCERPELWDLLTRRQWMRLFWERRAEAKREMRFVVFGHALHEKLLCPWPGITGKCLLLPGGPPDIAQTDRRLADNLAQYGRRLRPSNLTPLPVLAIPDAWPANSASSFYADTRYFR